MIKEYEDYKETLVIHVKEHTDKLTGIMAQDKTPDRRTRDLTNKLMDVIGYLNNCISLVEHDIRRMKEELEFKEEAGV